MFGCGVSVVAKEACRREKVNAFVCLPRTEYPRSFIDSATTRGDHNLLSD